MISSAVFTLISIISLLNSEYPHFFTYRDSLPFMVLLFYEQLKRSYK